MDSSSQQDQTHHHQCEAAKGSTEGTDEAALWSALATFERLGGKTGRGGRAAACVFQVHAAFPGDLAQPPVPAPWD
jgi:hypothetical protein